MNVLLFAKAQDLPEERIAEFRYHKGGDFDKISISILPGMVHEPCSPNFDAIRLNLSQLLAAGIVEIRLEVEA